MKASDSPLEEAAAAIEAKAADWAIRRAAGLTATETAELLCWLEGDVRRAGALREAEQTVGLLRRPRATGAAAVVWRELRARQAGRRTRRRALAWAGAGLAVAASLVFAFSPILRQRRGAPTAPMTVVVRPDRQTLPDGTVVHFNAGAEIRVRYTPDRRSVELLRGEALFTVIADAARPVVVAASGVEIRAVGTEFSVRRATADVDVLVTKGRVAVARTVVTLDAAGSASRSVAGTEPVYVAAGSRVSMPVTEAILAPIPVQPVTPSEMLGALAWRNKRVEFTGTALSEAVALFNAVNRIQVALGDPALAGLRISGVFWTDDPEAFATLLEMSLSLRAERAAANRIVLHRAE